MIERILARDKLLHFITGAMLCAALLPISAWVALTGVICAAVGKEVYDWHHKDKHTPEVLDAVATLAGGLFLLASCWLSHTF